MPGSVRKTIVKEKDPRTAAACARCLKTGQVGYDCGQQAVASFFLLSNTLLYKEYYNLLNTLRQEQTGQQLARMLYETAHNFTKFNHEILDKLEKKITGKRPDVEILCDREKLRDYLIEQSTAHGGIWHEKLADIVSGASDVTWEFKELFTSMSDMGAAEEQVNDLKKFENYIKEFFARNGIDRAIVSINGFENAEPQQQQPLDHSDPNYFGHYIVIELVDEEVAIVDPTVTRDRGLSCENREDPWKHMSIDEYFNKCVKLENINFTRVYVLVPKSPSHDGGSNIRKTKKKRKSRRKKKKSRRKSRKRNKKTRKKRN
jgi:hypothetical protein